MQGSFAAWGGLGVVLILAPIVRADFKSDVQQAAESVQALMPACEEKMTAGDLNGSEKVLFDAFPEKSRTAAESFMLGNLLFELDPRQSYALHKSAATAEPKNSDVAWEWGMEQHRAGEYAGALKSYELFSSSRPDFAGAYALQADCLLRLGKTEEAIAAWKKSESAPHGSIEQMEDLVCAVHREPAPHVRRTELLTQVTQKKSVQAAESLIALDSNFASDWWNIGPQKTYLAHDLPAVTAALGLGEGDLHVRSMKCAAECAQADRSDPEPVQKILKQYRLLIDPDQTLPSSPELLWQIVGYAAETKAIDPAILMDKIGPKIVALARKGKDPQLWSAAIVTQLSGDPAKLTQLARDGWKASGDPRFASDVLYDRERAGQLKWNDPDLQAAIKQFPESGEIHRAAFVVAVKENKVSRELLAEAAKAEFHHFSSFVAPATVVDRPRSDYLRQYFAMLLKMPATTQ